MSRHRKSRARTEKKARRGKTRALVMFLMLVLCFGLVLPKIHKQGVNWSTALMLTTALWFCCVFAFRACVRARRRTYSYGWQQAPLVRGDRNAKEDEPEPLPAAVPVIAPRKQRLHP